MKPFDRLTTSLPRNGNPAILVASPEGCAAQLLATVPRIMGALRCALASGDGGVITVPQFRILHFIRLHAGANLSAAADFLGLTLPSTSKLVDHMVRQGLVARNDDAADRRRMTLRVTHRGSALVKETETLLCERLAGSFSRYTPEQLEALAMALLLLQECFPSSTMDGPRRNVQAPGNESTGPTGSRRSRVKRGIAS